MTVLEMQAGVKIGGEYLLAVGSPDRDIRVRVWVRDLREVWGAPQARVEPVAGSGLTWVLVGRLLPVPSKGQSCGLPLGHAPEPTVVCSWCNTIISGPAPAMSSHGICRPCADALREENR